MSIVRNIFARLKAVCCEYSLKSYLKLNHSTIINNRGGRFLAFKYSFVELDHSSTIILNANLNFGVKQMRGSKMETRLLLEKDALLNVNKASSIYAGSFIRIMKGGKLTLDGCLINENVQITCGDEIIIGKGTNIGRGAVIRSYDSHVFEEKGLTKSAPIKIGMNVWVGQNAIIYKGVTIGDNSIIGAGCIITEDIPSNSVVGNLK